MGKLDNKVGGIKSPEAAQRSPTQTSEERRYKAEEALHTVRRYHEVAADSQLMGDVRKLATQQMATLAKVAGHASGAKSGEPKAAAKGGSSGGGKRK